MTDVLVVGLGAVDRGDDGIGPVVVARVQEALASGGGASGPTITCPPATVVVHEDPTALVELMAGRSLAVIVDALRSPGQAGSVHVIEAGQTPLSASTDPGPAGSHGFGLASSLELARALGSLPPRVVVVGVVGSRFAVGAPLSDPVAAAVPAAVASVLAVLGLSDKGAGPQGIADHTDRPVVLGPRQAREARSAEPRTHIAQLRRRREVGHVH